MARARLGTTKTCLSNNQCKPRSLVSAWSPTSIPRQVILVTMFGRKKRNAPDEDWEASLTAVVDDWQLTEDSMEEEGSWMATLTGLVETWQQLSEGRKEEEKMADGVQEGEESCMMEMWRCSSSVMECGVRHIDRPGGLQR